MPTILSFREFVQSSIPSLGKLRRQLPAPPWLRSAVVWTLLSDFGDLAHIDLPCVHAFEDVQRVKGLNLSMECVLKLGKLCTSHVGRTLSKHL